MKILFLVTILILTGVASATKVSPRKICSGDCNVLTTLKVVLLIVGSELNCLYSEYLTHVKTCFCQDWTDSCWGNEFNTCVRLPVPTNHTSCGTNCDPQTVSDNIDTFRSFDFNCLPNLLLAIIRHCYCKIGTPECPLSDFIPCLLTLGITPATIILWLDL